MLVIFDVHNNINIVYTCMVGMCSNNNPETPSLHALNMVVIVIVAKCCGDCPGVDDCQGSGDCQVIIAHLNNHLIVHQPSLVELLFEQWANRHFSGVASLLVTIKNDSIRHIYMGTMTLNFDQCMIIDHWCGFWVQSIYIFKITYPHNSTYCSEM